MKEKVSTSQKDRARLEDRLASALREIEKAKVESSGKIKSKRYYVEESKTDFKPLKPYPGGCRCRRGVCGAVCKNRAREARRGAPSCQRTRRESGRGTQSESGGQTDTGRRSAKAQAGQLTSIKNIGTIILRNVVNVKIWISGSGQDEERHDEDDRGCQDEEYRGDRAKP